MDDVIVEFQKSKKYFCQNRSNPKIIDQLLPFSYSN